MKPTYWSRPSSWRLKSELSPVPASAPPYAYQHTRAVAAELIASNPQAQGLRYRPRHDEDGFAYLLYTTGPDQNLDTIVERTDTDLPLGEGEGLELATLLLARYNVSVER